MNMSLGVAYQGESLESLIEQSNYINEVLNSGFEFEKWELKEYQQIKKDVEFKINECKKNPYYKN